MWSGACWLAAAVAVAVVVEGAVGAAGAEGPGAVSALGAAVERGRSLLLAVPRRAASALAVGSQAMPWPAQLALSSAREQILNPIHERINNSVLLRLPTIVIGSAVSSAMNGATDNNEEELVVFRNAGMGDYDTGPKREQTRAPKRNRTKQSKTKKAKIERVSEPRAVKGATTVKEAASQISEIYSKNATLVTSTSLPKADPPLHSYAKPTNSSYAEIEPEPASTPLP